MKMNLKKMKYDLKKNRYTEIVIILLSFSTTSYEQNKALNLYSNRQE